MICDNCTHNEVCMHKEDCNILERSTKPYKLEEYFSLKIECKHKETRPQLLARTEVIKTLNSYQMP